jgi:hypothetical protein
MGRGDARRAGRSPFMIDFVDLIADRAMPARTGVRESA